MNTNKEGYKSVSYDKLMAILVEVVKEQQEQINNLMVETGRMELRVFYC